MDSMTGIVFFMLIGRFFQNKTYETLSFERDYKSYFPIGVSVIYEDGKEENLPVSELKKGDHIIIRNNELIPSDALLLSNSTHIDYSFITGESSPVKRKKGDLIYAGGKQLDGAIELEIINPVSQSYLTQLWNKDVQGVKESKASKYFVDTINKYFSIAVLSIALLSAAYWLYFDSSKALNALSSVLLVACPCGLLLTATFANGNLLRIFGRNKFYLKNASVIDKLRNTDTIIFDKTGTITQGSNVQFSGKVTDYMLQLVTSLAAQSSHPLSRKIHYNYNAGKLMPVTDFEEITGKGIKGYVDSNYVILGSEYFVTGRNSATNNLASKVFLMIEGDVIGYFSFDNAYRDGLEELIGKLSGEYDLNLLSGDNDSERDNLKKLFGKDTILYFNQKPEEKKMFVERLLHLGKNVMMIGDGLNDAGALKQSDIGIAVSDDTNNFSPACDAILDGESFAKLPAFIHLAKAGKNVIIATFIVSLLYNAVGLFFAIQGLLSPVIAAILMPISSVSIVLLVTISTSIIARRKGL
jgi:Cu+-exporting ATPase